MARRSKKSKRKSFEEIFAAIQDPETRGAFFLADGKLGDPEDPGAPSLDVKFVMCRTSRGEDRCVALMLDEEVEEFISEAIEVATDASDEPDEEEDEDEDEDEDGDEEDELDEETFDL